MTTRSPDQRFEEELEVFRSEAEGALQFFYAYLTVHAVAVAEASVYEALNETPLFGNTMLSALQTATFIALGRIFDRRSPHNVDALLRIASEHPQIFSRASLGLRKQAAGITSSPLLAQVLQDAYLPIDADFRRLCGLVEKRRAIYDANYRPLRHKVFAHLEAADAAVMSALFAQTNVTELQQLLVFLGSLYEALWQLFFNGRKPVLRPQRYSVSRMRDVPSVRNRRVQERVVQETEQFLRRITGPRDSP